jgi:hypothetical protein
LRVGEAGTQEREIHEMQNKSEREKERKKERTKVIFKNGSDL